MEDWVHRVFAVVCGQVADRTWWPGGVALPFCQRCTGLYVGAFFAGLLQAGFRPAPDRPWLWVYGGCLLLMVPLGYHWVPHGPVVRTLSGFVFAFGLVGILLVLPRTAWTQWRGRTPVTPSAGEVGRWWAMAASSVAGGGVLVGLARRGGPVSHDLLEIAGCLGLGGLALLAGLNLALLLGVPCGRWLRRSRLTAP